MLHVLNRLTKAFEKLGEWTNAATGSHRLMHSFAKMVPNNIQI